MLTRLRFGMPKLPDMTGNAGQDVKALAAHVDDIKRTVLDIFSRLEAPGALRIDQATIHNSVVSTNSAVTVKPPARTTSLYAGTDASDNGTDDAAIWVDQISTDPTKYSIGIGCVNVFSPPSTITAPTGIGTAGDFWSWLNLDTSAAQASQTFSENNGLSTQVSVASSSGKTATVTNSRGLKVQTPTKSGAGTQTITTHYGVDILSQTGFASVEGAMRIANANLIRGRNAASSADIDIAAVNSSDQVVIGDANKTLVLQGNAVTGRGYLINTANFIALDPADATTYFLGQWFPSTTAGGNKIYIPKAGTIRVVQVYILNLGVAGSNENSTMYIRLNNTTDTSITTTVSTNNTSQPHTASVSVAVALNDYIEFKWITPTWTTNPTQLYFAVSLYIE